MRWGHAAAPVRFCPPAVTMHPCPHDAGASPPVHVLLHSSAEILFCPAKEAARQAALLPVLALLLPDWAVSDQQSQSPALQRKQRVRQPNMTRSWVEQCLRFCLARQCRQVFGGQSPAHAVAHTRLDILQYLSMSIVKANERRACTRGCLA